MTPILHHYPASPFAELIRVALGYKGLEWRSVVVPNMMPKPGQTELTGGYGRTPVLQIGADIYCDSAAIIDALEAFGPTLYPAPLGALHRIVASWTGAAQFAAHVGAAMEKLPPGLLPPGFAEDRRQRFVGFDFDAMPQFAPHLKTQVSTAAVWLDSVLADGRAFIGGDEAGHGDLALYSNLWFVRSIPFAKDVADRLFAHAALAAWFDRIAAFGHGTPVETTADEAIAIARDAAPAAATGSVSGGFTSGQAVKVRTEGSNDEPVAGTLQRCDASGITVLRNSARAGQVAVHFPRLGQIVMAG